MSCRHLPLRKMDLVHPPPPPIPATLPLPTTVRLAAGRRLWAERSRQPQHPPGLPGPRWPRWLLILGPRERAWPARRNNISPHGGSSGERPVCSSCCFWNGEQVWTSGTRRPPGDWQSALVETELPLLGPA